MNCEGRDFYCFGSVVLKESKLSPRQLFGACVRCHVLGFLTGFYCAVLEWKLEGGGKGQSGQ